MIVGQIVGGNNINLIIREKKGVGLELGDMVAVEEGNKRYLYLVSQLEYGALVDEDRLFTSAGSMLESQNPNVEIPEKDLRIFRKVTINPLIEVIRREGNGEEKEKAQSPRSIPPFLSKVREIKSEDFSFLEKPESEILVGKIRSGSKCLDYNYYVNGSELFSHHALVSAQTGRGKSNLVKVMLWDAMKHDNFGILVLDVHNEYFGHGTSKGLGSHLNAGRSLVYYSVNPPPGGRMLTVNLKSLKPQDLRGVVSLTEAQKGALDLCFRETDREWIKELLTDDPSKDKEYERKGISLTTIYALRRKLGNLFKMRTGAQTDGAPYCTDKVFDLETMGENTTKDMAQALEDGKTVLIDGSCIPDDTGMILISAVMRDIFRRYEGYRDEGLLGSKPQIGVVLEEAPRVLGESYGDNIFGRVAREGRKFKIGLLAVTQMVSVIPDEILANIGTKIIMGNEMAQERRRLIESACQDLTAYDQLIAGLGKGEAIVSSIFSKFPVPIYIPLFEELVAAETHEAEKNRAKKSAQQVYF